MDSRETPPTSNAAEQPAPSTPALDARRNALKAGVGTALVAGGQWEAGAQSVAPVAQRLSRPPSPATRPFVDRMPIIPQLPSRPLTDPAFASTPPSKWPNRAINPATKLPFEGRGDPHQFRELAEPTVFFAMRYGAVPPVKIHSDLNPQTNFWGANLGGENLATDRPVSPLPTIVTRYSDHRNPLDNKAVIVRRFNNLPTGAPSGGFGKNSITVHTHNFHGGPDTDGGPCDPSLGASSVDPWTQGRFFFPGQYYDYYYNMKRAGFIDPTSYSSNPLIKTTPSNVIPRLNPAMPHGDVRETLGTLWYHEHREGGTSANIYKGLAGFHLIFNEYDTGDETTGFRLPSYPKYDIPILITDIWVNPSTGQTEIDLSNIDGHLGDKYLVNGKIQPFFPVDKRRYRLRLLNKGPSRYQILVLTNPANPTQNIPFWIISSDGNLLTKPVQATSVRLSPAQRVDVIVDFAAIAATFGAQTLWLENRGIHTEPEKPTGDLAPIGMVANAVIEFRIGAAVADASANPATITSFAPISLPPIPTPAVTRTFDWKTGDGGWSVNGEVVDCLKVRFWMKRGRPERWIYNLGGGWGHPLHMHFVEGRITRRNGVAVPATSPAFGRVDIVDLYPGESAEFIVTPTDYVGVYPLHCHNSVHEDYGMMLLFGVDDVGDTKAQP